MWTFISYLRRFGTLGTSFLSDRESMLASSFKWCPTSDDELEGAESDLLAGKYRI